MPMLKQFSTPARQNDFPNNPTLWQLMQSLWSTNVDAFTRQCITGDPWNMQFESNQLWYYNPLDTNMPTDAIVKAVTWNAFPNRLNVYYGPGQQPPNPYNFGFQTLWQMADTGAYNNGTFPQIPATRCPEPNWKGTLQPYGPYGPRGWLDEYCEWSVTRRSSDNKIVRVDFCCENPEYWQTLWRVNPETAAQVYTDTLNAGLPPSAPAILVTVDDLTLYDPTTGKPVIDPSTGKPAYNPLNRWNSGPVSERVWAGAGSDTGGAMHLTSTPNTLQTELGLAGAATVQRQMGNSDPQALICCSQYGQNFRHSDPHIGQSVNQVVGLATGNLVVSLADPPGLYIQQPTDSVFQANFRLPKDPNLPAGASAKDCWQIIRGKETLIDEMTGKPYPGNFILHVAFQIPAAWIAAGVSFTVGDIQVQGPDGNFYPIQWASQIAEQFNIGLFARAFPPGYQGATFYGPSGVTGATAPVYPCVTGATGPVSQPLQIVYQDLWNAYYDTNVPNPAGFTMNLASNSSIIPPIIAQGASGHMALTAALGNEGATGLPDVYFQANGVNATVLGMTGIFYAVPGNSYPSASTLLNLFVNVGATAPTGLQSVIIVQRGDNPSAIQPAPAFLNIVGASGITGLTGASE